MTTGWASAGDRKATIPFGNGSNRKPPNRLIYFAEQGVGFHPAASGSFLKSEVVMYGRVK